MDRRGFLGASLVALSGVAGFFVSIPFVKSFLPSAKARALADPVEIDLNALAPGEVGTYLYRGRTMLVLRRTDEMLAQLDKTADRLLDTSAFSDPSYVDSTHRAIDPRFLVVEGVCTHLGCVPRKLAEQGKPIVGNWWTGGFICPCHQSGFDYAGRVVKGPAPRNLPIPPHRFAGSARLVIGETSEVT
jgi:ubiquinol-cytochrome c reductase iron-sulfur subunit